MDLGERHQSPKASLSVWDLSQLLARLNYSTSKIFKYSIRPAKDSSTA